MSTVPTVTVQQRQPGCLLTLFGLFWSAGGRPASGLAWPGCSSLDHHDADRPDDDQHGAVGRHAAAAGRRIHGDRERRLAGATIPQHNFLLRALYFVLIGWWFSAGWLAVAWAASVTLIGIPLAIWMYNRVPAITTLRRY